MSCPPSRETRNREAEAAEAAAEAEEARRVEERERMREAAKTRSDSNSLFFVLTGSSQWPQLIYIKSCS